MLSRDRKGEDGISQEEAGDDLLRARRGVKVNEKCIDDLEKEFISAGKLSNNIFIELADAYKAAGKEELASIIPQLGHEVAKTMDYGPAGLFIGAQAFFERNKYCPYDKTKAVEKVMLLVAYRLGSDSRRYYEEESLAQKEVGRFIESASKSITSNVSTWMEWRNMQGGEYILPRKGWLRR